MELTATVSTDTATLVIFDPARLEAHLVDESDWWTGSGDLEREEALENLLFVAPAKTACGMSS
jgi:hypothetical protein